MPYECYRTPIRATIPLFGMDNYHVHLKREQCISSAVMRSWAAFPDMILLRQA